MKHKTEQLTADQLYRSVKELRRRADLSTVSSERADYAVQAAKHAHILIERVALFASGLDATFLALNKNVITTKRTNPRLYKEMVAVIGKMLEVRGLLMTHYPEESELCEGINREVREKMCAEAGIKPDERDKARAYLDKVGVLACPANPRN